MKTFRSKALSGALFALVALAPLQAAAQAFPTRPVTMIVSFPPGGAIGTATIANAPKTGYTVGFIAAASLTTLPQLQPVTYRLDSFERAIAAEAELNRDTLRRAGLLTGK